MNAGRGAFEQPQRRPKNQHVYRVPGSPRALCSMCEKPRPRLMIEPVIDRLTGQRVAVALCHGCALEVGRLGVAIRRDLHRVGEKNVP